MIVWLEQLVSTIGSGMTGFALGVSVYAQTGSTTDFARTWSSQRDNNNPWSQSAAS
jgi:hypothetical protein